MADARVVSNYLVKRAEAESNTLTSMQVLKLVYIAHGYMLGAKGTPLIENSIEAWKYGPVIPDLYRAISHFRDTPVQQINSNVFRDLVESEIEMVDAAYEVYGRDDGIYLSSLTHKAGTPWHKVYRPNKNHIPIPNDLIENHYRELLG